MDYNYHTHTYWCHHASGTPEEYIKRAIENGIKYMGFSEHMPFRRQDGGESGYRMYIADAKKYVNEIRELREKYKQQIDIKIGFEMEYYPSFFNDMLKNATHYGGEYLILGEHQVGDEYPKFQASANPTESIEDLKQYVSDVVSGIKTKVFSFVAHPDIINFVGDKSIYKQKMREICIASRHYNIPLEINFLGIRGNRCYPNETFWEIAGQEGAPVTFAFDAHDTLNAYDGASLKYAKELVDKYGLNYIGKPEIINIQI